MRQPVYTSLLLKITLCFTWGKTKINSTIKKSQDILNRIVAHLLLISCCNCLISLRQSRIKTFICFCENILLVLYLLIIHYYYIYLDFYLFIIYFIYLFTTIYLHLYLHMYFIRKLSRLWSINCFLCLFFKGYS